MKQFCLFIIIGFLWSSSAFGQLLVVGNQNISKEEFVRLYKKNIPEANFSERSLRAYLELLIAYKLRLQEAENSNIDQLPHIQTQLTSHANQLIQPYLTDREMLERMLLEAYEHSLQDVRARQIMVRVPFSASPQDTLSAFEKAMHIRNRLMNGEDFKTVATEESENSQLITVGHRQERRVSSSDLGYFNAFSMPYSIEKFAFSSEIGEFSMPLRTAIGFHIVQTMDRQPTLGRINASQIFLNIPNPDEAEAVGHKADSLYRLIISGSRTFEDVARQYSDDRISGVRGGQMAEFNVMRACPEFIYNLYRIPIRVVNRPFRSLDGYHIVVIHSLGYALEFEYVRSELLFRLQRDPRAELIRQSFVASLRERYTVVETPGALERFANRLDPNDIMGFWMYQPDELSSLKLVQAGNQTATFGDFGAFIQTNQMNFDLGNEPFMTFIERNYRLFVEEMLILNEAENVKQTNESFKRDFNTFREGALVFEITNQRVWRRAVEDTAGLREFFGTVQHRFIRPARIQALVFTYDVRHVDTQSVRRFLEQARRRRLGPEQVVEQANRNFNTNHISVTFGTFEPGQNRIVDRADWSRIGLSHDIATGGFEKGFVYIHDFLPPSPRAFEEVRGIIAGLYQAYLERTWIESLRRRYTVQVNQTEFENLINR